MGTRISAQVRSHAQKVLKDYSPNAPKCELSSSSDEEGDEIEQPMESHSIPHVQQASDGMVDSFAMPKEESPRTDDLNYKVEALDALTRKGRPRALPPSSFIRVGQKRSFK